MEEVQNNNGEVRGQEFSLELITIFLDNLSEEGKAAGTISAYRRCLLCLYDFLPEKKTVYEDTLEDWRRHLNEKKLSDTSVELYCSAANSFMVWCGRWDLRINMRKRIKKVQPELTRNEYLRLLSAAQRLEKERTYLLIKTFATLGISVRELCCLTVEAVNNGKILLPRGKETGIPGCMHEELMQYAKRQNIHSGILFRTSSGKAIDRANVWDSINALAGEAHVDEEKCNPRCLNRLCEKTKGDIRKNVEILEMQMYDNLLESEQKVIGWE